MEFRYEGALGASKSLLNRALIVQSYFPELQIEGDSACDDVQDLKKNLSALETQKDFVIREGGTTFRFLALRLSRFPGKFRLSPGRRLLARPQRELQDVLAQLNVKTQKNDTDFFIEGDGWKIPEQTLTVDRGRSSQFLSSLILNSALLPGKLKIKTLGPSISENYLQMTLRLARELGMEIRADEGHLEISPWDRLAKKKYRVGADLSSAFALAAFAAAGGSLHVTNLHEAELQPDFEFVSFFRTMGLFVQVSPKGLRVEKKTKFGGLRASLDSCPDLFPVLSCLCALAETPSELSGAPQLKHKESNRLEKIFELFDKARISYRRRDDGISIAGGAVPHGDSFEFDPDQDHRMAMAAAFLKFHGWNISICTPEVVTKSFPEFWDIVRVNP